MQSRLTDLSHRLRLQRGLFWQGRRPALRDYSEALRIAALLIILLGIYTLAGTIDYATEQSLEADRQAARADATERTTADCMNGRAQWLYDNDTEAGYGKTLVTCLGVEAIPL